MMTQSHSKTSILKNVQGVACIIAHDGLATKLTLQLYIRQDTLLLILPLPLQCHDDVAKKNLFFFRSCIKRGTTSWLCGSAGGGSALILDCVKKELRVVVDIEVCHWYLNASFVERGADSSAMAVECVIGKDDVCHERRVISQRSVYRYLASKGRRASWPFVAAGFELCPRKVVFILSYTMVCVKLFHMHWNHAIPVLSYVIIHSNMPP